MSYLIKNTIVCILKLLNYFSLFLHLLELVFKLINASDQSYGNDCVLLRSDLIIRPDDPYKKVFNKIKLYQECPLFAIIEGDDYARSRLNVYFNFQLIFHLTFMTFVLVFFGSIKLYANARNWPESNYAYFLLSIMFINFLIIYSYITEPILIDHLDSIYSGFFISIIYNLFWIQSAFLDLSLIRRVESILKKKHLDMEV